MSTAIYELFEKEGLADDYHKLSAKHLYHADDFLKFSREYEVEPDTVIFGNPNRLMIIKTKMKNNQSFQENADCQEISKLLSWVEEQRALLELDEDTEKVADISVLDKESVENIISAVTELEEEQEAEQVEEASIFAQEHIVPEELESEPEPEPEPAVPLYNLPFTFEYLAEPVSISKIADGFSIHDYNPKELAYAVIKRLNAC